MPFLLLLLLLLLLSTLIFFLLYVGSRRIHKRLTTELEKRKFEQEQNDRLVAIISHDIVTPLRFLHVVGRNMLDHGDNMSQDMKSDIMQEIVYTALDLEILSSNILGWVRYRKSGRFPDKERFSLFHAIDQSLGMLRLLARHKKINISNTIEDAYGHYRFVEPLKIIIYNLVLNAIRSMEKGSITIRSRQMKRGFMIEVKDQGCGMTIDQIHSLLSEAPAAQGQQYAGTNSNGLGYLIIKDLLRVTGGRFYIASKLQAGTSIRLFFPALSCQNE